MIITEGLRKTTRLTVCNYDEYQFEQQTKNKQRTRREQAGNKEITTNKNEENIKNDNNEEEPAINKAWLRWKEFKKLEFSFNYKSEISEQAAKNELITLAGNDEETAIKIIEQSIAKGWKGFFKLKNNGNERTNSKGGATPEQLRELIARTESTDK
jgi:hypothetical protein